MFYQYKQKLKLKLEDQLLFKLSDRMCGFCVIYTEKLSIGALLPGQMKRGYKSIFIPSEAGSKEIRQRKNGLCSREAIENS